MSFATYLFILTMSVAPLAAATELQTAAAKAAQFLCQSGYCLKRTPPVSYKEDFQHVAYFNRAKNEIWVSPRLTSAESQIALVHELTHVYRNQSNDHEALWLDEGLAKFMEYKYSGVWPKSYSERLK